MWRRVEVINYRSIERASVELAPFTILVGPNGSGKSNFADALVFSRDIAIDAASAVQSRGGILGVRRWSRSRPYDVTIDIRVARNKESLDHDYFRHAFTIKSLKDSAWRFSDEDIEAVRDGKRTFNWRRDGDRVSGRPAEYVPDELAPTTSAMLYARQLLRTRSGTTLSSGAVRRFRMDPDEMRKPQPASEGRTLSENGANVASVVAQFRSQDDPVKLRQVIDAMSHIVPGLTDLSADSTARFHSLRFKQRSGSGVDAEFSASEMSEGSLRALGVILAARQMRPNELLIIEEPEANIHPGAAAIVFDVLKEASRHGGVLITTHSPELLNAACDEEILVCQLDSGATRIGNLDEGQRKAVRDGLLSVAELMRTETLRIEGASPEVFSPDDAST